MDSRIKIVSYSPDGKTIRVSILVLMDSRIKIFSYSPDGKAIRSFNPCFNG